MNKYEIVMVDFICMNLNVRELINSIEIILHSPTSVYLYIPSLISYSTMARAKIFVKHRRSMIPKAKIKPCDSIAGSRSQIFPGENFPTFSSTTSHHLRWSYERSLR